MTLLQLKINVSDKTIHSNILTFGAVEKKKLSLELHRTIEC